MSFIAGVPLLLWLWNDPSIREERCPKTRSKTQKLLLSFWGQNLLVFFLILTPAMSIVLQPFRDGGSFETKKVTLHPLGDAWGFEEVAIFADALRKSHLSQEKTPLLTYHWANAGRLNLGFRDPYQVVAVGKKANQYSLWTDESSLLGKDYILVRDRMFRQKFERSFDCRVLQELPSFWVELYDYKIRRWDFVLCQNLRQIRRH